MSYRRAVMMPARLVGRLLGKLGVLGLQAGCRDAVSRIDLGFPHDFLARPSMARTLRGDLGEKLIP